MKWHLETTKNLFGKLGNLTQTFQTAKFFSPSYTLGTWGHCVDGSAAHLGSFTHGMWTSLRPPQDSGKTPCSFGESYIPKNKTSFESQRCFFSRIYGCIPDGLLSFESFLMNCSACVFFCWKLWGIPLFHAEKHLETYYEHQFLTPFALYKINVDRR